MKLIELIGVIACGNVVLKVCENDNKIWEGYSTLEMGNMYRKYGDFNVEVVFPSVSKKDELYIVINH